MKRPLPWYVALVGVTVLAYLPALWAGYIWDDGAYVQYNPTLRSLEGLWRIWFEFGATQDYYPLTFTTFWLEYRLWGPAPAGYHFNNVLLHGLNSVLLAHLLNRLRAPGALLAAAIFALHPVHVESVAWITERKNVLSGLFFLLSLHAYVRFEDFENKQPSPSHRTWCYVASLAFFLLAMLSKTVTVTLPFVLPVIVWWQHGRLSWRDLAVTLPYFILAIPVFGLSLVSGANFGGAGVPITGSNLELWNYTLLERFLIAGRCLWFYALKLFYPVELSFVYPRWEIDRSVWWQYLFPITAFSVPIVFLLMRNRWGRGPAAAVLFFGLTLAPASGFFSFYFQRYSFVADHLQYLASMGLIGLAAGIAATAMQRLSPRLLRIAPACGAVALLLLGVLTFQQCFAYRGLESLWRDTLEKNPQSEMAHTNLGLLLREQNRLDEALEHFYKARDLAPHEAIVYNNLGTVLMLQGDPSAAAEHFEQALALDPQLAEGASNLGLALVALGRHDDGLHHLERAVEIGPDSASGHFNLAATLHQRGRLEDAIGHYLTTIELDRLNVAARYNLAMIYREQGRPAKAAEYLEQAARIQADNP